MTGGWWVYCWLVGWWGTVILWLSSAKAKLGKIRILFNNLLFVTQNKETLKDLSGLDNFPVLLTSVN
jgi:hypothetical protein